MIFLFPNGQLGNQFLLLFAVVSMSRPNEHVFAINYHSAVNFFRSSPLIHFIGSGARYSLYKRLFTRFIYFVYSRRVFFSRFVSFLEESELGAVSSSLTTLFPPLFTIIYDCYLQNECFFESTLPSSLSISSSLSSRVSNWFLVRNIQHDYKIFVHIRRGEYLTWSPSPKIVSCVPPDSYYLDSLKYLLSLYPESVVLVSSDDHAYVQRLFLDFKYIFFVNEDPFFSLAILSQCHSGILSPSSFSFAAAYLSFSFLFSDSSLPTYIAPKYWIGFSILSWYPNFFYAKFIKYLLI